MAPSPRWELEQCKCALCWMESNTTVDCTKFTTRPRVQKCKLKIIVDDDESRLRIGKVEMIHKLSNDIMRVVQRACEGQFETFIRVVDAEAACVVIYEVCSASNKRLGHRDNKFLRALISLTRGIKVEDLKETLGW